MKPSPLVDQLVRIAERDDRAALASLRRGLGKPPGAATEMFAYVAPFVPSAAADHGEDWPWYLVASLFGAHPCHAESGNFGDSFRKLPANESRNLRFRALVEAETPDECAAHLRHATRMMASHAVGVDYHRLLAHLRHWEAPDRWVQRKWSWRYWGAGKEWNVANTEEK